MNDADPASFLYFAYGSNLLTRRLRERTPSARVVGVAVLRQHALLWHKAATDGSGKCDVVPCDTPDGDGATQVQGVVYEIDRADKPALDAAETLGVGYGEREVEVELADGRRLKAWAYVALRTDPASVPYDWYHALVLHGAREHAFPEAYLKTLEAVLTKADADTGRAARHFGLIEQAGFVDRGEAAIERWKQGRRGLSVPEAMTILQQGLDQARGSARQRTKR